MNFYLDIIGINFVEFLIAFYQLNIDFLIGSCGNIFEWNIRSGGDVGDQLQELGSAPSKGCSDQNRLKSGVMKCFVVALIN